MTKDDRRDPPNVGLDDDSTVPIGAELRQLVEVSKVRGQEDESDATVQVDLASLLSSAPDAAGSASGMDVSVALGSGPQEAASVGHVATKQMDVASLAAGMAQLNAARDPGGPANVREETIPSPEGFAVPSEVAGGNIRSDTVTEPESFPAPAMDDSRPIERVTARVDMAEVARLLTEAAAKEKEKEVETPTGIRDLSKLAGNIVANVGRDDPTLDVTIRGDMQNLLTGVLEFVSSDRGSTLDPDTRAAMAEFAAELADSLESEALGKDKLSATLAKLPAGEDAPTIRGDVSALVAQALETVEASTEAVTAPATEEEVPALHAEVDEEMATIQVDSSQLPAAIRLAPIPGATELRPMQPDRSAQKTQVEAAPPAMAAAAAAELVPDLPEPPAAEIPPPPPTPLAPSSPKPSAPVADAQRKPAGRKYIVAIVGLLLLIGALSLVAGYLAWRGGHLAFLEKALGG